MTRKDKNKLIDFILTYKVISNTRIQDMLNALETEFKLTDQDYRNYAKDMYALKTTLHKEKIKK